MSFSRVRRIADAVLLEGYVLYPYRASSTKNRWRFPFGVLAPRAWSEAGGCEPWWMEAQCLVEAEAESAPRVNGLLRFLHARRRTIEGLDSTSPPQPPRGAGEGEDPVHHWDEGEIQEVPFSGEAGADAGEAGFELPSAVTEELARDAVGEVVGRAVRRVAALRGRIALRWERVAAERPLWRLAVRVENVTPWSEQRARRDDVLPASCLAAHLLLEAERGAFVSSLDPPEWSRAAAAACRSTRAFPVLAGEEGRRDVVLASPIILYDHPRIAPESPGDFFDATEIDELLALRTATLTEEEKREARATDPRAAAVIDQVEALGPEGWSHLHGAFRDRAGGEMSPGEPMPPSAAKTRDGERGPGGGVRPGDRVRLRPGVRRTDAQDLLYAGHVATVREVRHDVDGREWLAVTVDDDPAAELNQWYGRHHHYLPDEVEPLGGEEGP